MHTRKLYDAPRYYEIAFSFRDYEREVALLVDLHDRLGQGELRSVLEIASGPASHLKALHRRGIAYTGLDLSSEMIDYASRRASELGARARFVQQDFCRFELDEHVDLAFVLLGSLMLPDQAALVSHFDSVARCLGPGGLYLLDWCVKFSWPEEEMEPWEMTDGSVSVRVSGGSRVISRARQLVADHLQLDVDDGGERFTVVDDRQCIVVFPQEFLRFIEARPDFEFVGWWNNWDLGRPLDGLREVNRPIVVVRRV